MRAWRRSMGMLLGFRPASLQVGAMCRDPVTRRVLLITSRETARWVIPKGWPMAGRSLSGAAAQEAWEEAGVRGRVDPDELGRFQYQKKHDQGYAIPIEMRVFLLSVDEISDIYPEMGQRKRRWFDPSEAMRMVVEPGLKDILAAVDAHDRP